MDQSVPCLGHTSDDVVDVVVNPFARKPGWYHVAIRVGIGRGKAVPVFELQDTIERFSQRLREIAAVSPHGVVEFSHQGSVILRTVHPCRRCLGIGFGMLARGFSIIELCVRVS